MTDLQLEFDAASNAIKHLSPRPDNASLLRLYGLYKQATDGDVHGPKPGFFDFVGNAKHEAWNGLQGMPREEAMRAYIELATHLCAPSTGTASTAPDQHDRT